MTEHLIPPTVAAVLLFSSCATGDQPVAIDVAASGPTTSTPASAPSVGDAHKGMTVATINGRELTEAQLDAFKVVYGTVPAPGRWWYDAVSGMFGADGQGAAGFMYPGHDFGPLAADASLGDALVFFNGRRLTLSEVDNLGWLAGGRVEPGRYWVDAQLNWGAEGAADPAGNLRQLAMARSAGGGGGNNTWSGLVGAGNSNDEAAVGYVSIPGVGPIGSNGTH